MACVQCGSCCRKFMVYLRLGDRALQLIKEGKEDVLIRFRPKTKFEGFLQAMGLNTEKMFVRVPVAGLTGDTEMVKATFFRTCPHLADSNMCDLHDTGNKPEFCREWLCSRARLDATEILVPDKLVATTEILNVEFPAEVTEEANGARSLP